jgi:hypothetical protein
MKVYVASSWRNDFQKLVVQALRADGFEVYDFKDSEGFSWREVDPDWERWPQDRPKYIEGMNHPTALRGYGRDMSALENCDICVMVMPCGMSASLETGWAVGAGKHVAVYIPAMREPDLMVKMAHFVTLDLEALRDWCSGVRAEAA